MTARTEEDDVVYVSTPFGLMGQWLQLEELKRKSSALRKELRTGLNDWDGRWSMLHWVTEKVIDDHAIANETPRNYARDMSLEYHLTFWFLTARLCYDTIGYLAVQMAAERDRGMFDFLEVANIEDFSYPKWAKSAQG